MSLTHAASVQSRVIGALVLREARAKFGQSQLGYFWALVEPTLWVLTFLVAFEVGGRSLPPGMEPLPYLVTGIGTFHLFQKIAESLTGSIGGNRSLLVFPHVIPMDVFVAKSVLTFCTVLVVNLLLLSVHILLEGDLPSVPWPLTILFAAMGAGTMGFGLGLTLGAISNYTVAVNRVKIVIMRPLFWTSGLFFTANDLPTSVRDILLYNPVLHATELVRGGFFQHYDARHADPGYLFGWTVGLLLVGMACERAARSRTES